MKQNIVRITVFNLFLAATLVTLVPAAHGQSCSASGAAGTYAFHDMGEIIGVGPRHAVARLTLTAAGGISGPLTASLNGTVSRATLSGTFTVNANCSGTLSVSEFDQSGNLVLAATADVVWVDAMHELHFIFTSATLANGSSLPNVISGTAEKLGAQMNP